MNYATKQEAVSDAMEQLINDGEFRPHNPAIIKDGQSKYYLGSTLNMVGDDEIIFNLSDGFGSFEPESISDIEDCANGFCS